MAFADDIQSLHPGIMPTELQRDSPGPMRFLMVRIPNCYDGL